MTTFETAKARAYGAAFNAFFRVMRKLVGEDGIARLANDADEHLVYIGVGHARMMPMQVAIAYGPITEAPGIDELFTTERKKTAARYIQCNTCKRKSYNENDIRHAYCGACHKWHNSPSDFKIGFDETSSDTEKGIDMFGMDATSLRSFEHYKGGTYTLLYVARNSEKRDELLAVYASHQTQVIWVRPFDMFCELVTWPDGSRHPRFREIARTKETPT